MQQRMSGRLVAFGVFATIASAVACSSDSAGPSLSGSWHGFVVMHNEFGVPLTSDSGVVVTLSNNGHAGPSTVSSANGSYTFDGVHTGAYTLAYSGDAMGTFLRPEVAFVGGGNWIYSYDLTAVYYAVRPGDGALTTVGAGKNVINGDGSNTFVKGSGNQYYLKLTNTNGLDHSIEALLDKVPAH